MANQSYFSANVPTTFIWDVQRIQQLQEISPEFKEILVRLYQNLGLMATSLNEKDRGLYNTLECPNSQSYFPNPAYNSSTSTQPSFRPVLRKVINFGSLPNTATKSVAHGIVCLSITTFTRIYGVASDTTGLTYIPLPYASPVLANNIELNVDATNVNVTTGSNRSNYNVTYIVLEYLQS